MENLKHKIVKLIQELEGFKLLKEIVKDESFELNTFEQSKEEFLEIHQIFLLNNNEKGDLVIGLKELIDNVKKTKSETVIVNSLEKDTTSILLYTDSAYSEIMGVL